MSIAVRPEKMRVAWAQPMATNNAVSGKVHAEAYFGDRSHYHIAIDGWLSRLPSPIKRSTAASTIRAPSAARSG